MPPASVHLPHYPLAISRTTGDGKFPLADSLSRVAQCFANILDLKVGVVIGKDKQIDLVKGEIGLHATPLVVNDVIIVGSSMFEGIGYNFSTNAKGLVRAFDARTGKQIWRFNTIPKPGEFGNDTWENG